MENEQKQVKIRVDGREILFPPLDIDMGEMCDAEEFFGVQWDKPARSGVRLTAAYLWIAIKRIDPTVTVDDVRKIDPAILKQLNEMGDDQSPPDQTLEPPEQSKPELTEPSEPSSTPASDGSEPDLSPIGDLGSGIGSGSVLETSLD